MHAIKLISTWLRPKRLIPLLLLVFGGIVAVFASWVYAIQHPEFFFSHIQKVGRFEVYSDEAIDPQITNILTEVQKRIETAETYDPEQVIKIVNTNRGLYYTLAGRSITPRAFGDITCLGGKIDCERNRLILPAVEMNLTYLLTHEAVHNGQYRLHGLFTTAMLALNEKTKWKIEGYADWVAQANRLKDNPDSIAEAVNTLNDNPPDKWVNLGDQYTMPWSYLQYRVLIEYLLTVRKMSYQEIIDADISQEEAWNLIIPNTSLHHE